MVHKFSLQMEHLSRHGIELNTKNETKRPLTTCLRYSIRKITQVFSISQRNFKLHFWMSYRNSQPLNAKVRPSALQSIVLVFDWTYFRICSTRFCKGVQTMQLAGYFLIVRIWCRETSNRVEFVPMYFSFRGFRIIREIVCSKV